MHPLAGRKQSPEHVAKRTRIKHGANRTNAGKRWPEYRSWDGMIQRCSNPNSNTYAGYGARGIAVCDRWLEFVNFLADMGRKPGPGYSLERINNEGDYEPSNCRWATAKEQRANQRAKLYRDCLGRRNNSVHAA